MTPDIYTPYSLEPIPILEVSLNKYTAINLSFDNHELKDFDLENLEECQNYIDKVLKRSNATVAYGGYLEQRNLYQYKSIFSSMGQAQRNIHLGLDFWCKAGTKVIAPLNGVVHSFRNNHANGDYGPTIILEHNYKSKVFYSLYGHLSVTSLIDLYKGKSFCKGDILGELGTHEENVNYAPHLHFQLINDISDYCGDYPGVCAKEDLDFYSKNCPNPNLLLNLETC